MSEESGAYVLYLQSKSVVSVCTVLQNAPLFFTPTRTGK